jgi:hypothetical protein
LKSSTGKVLVEKLLRACDVDTIYLLIRTKKGVEPKERLEEYVNHIVSVINSFINNWQFKSRKKLGVRESERIEPE